MTPAEPTPETSDQAADEVVDAQPTQTTESGDDAAASVAQNAEAPAEQTAEPAEQTADPAEHTPESDVAAPAPSPAPTPRAMPTPRMVARPKPPVAAPAPAPAAPSGAEPTDGEPWGRVEDDGTVSVREASGWRVVGEYPDGTPAEALAYFERKYADLVSEVVLLEARHRSGGASAADLRQTAAAVRGRVDNAAAVGDLASLLVRLDALDAALAESSEAEAAAAREKLDEAIVERTAIVEELEQLAARDPKQIQWKQATTQVTALFERWQTHQAQGPRLPKNLSQQLWKRFRDARGVLDRGRREFYAQLDEVHKTARDAKNKLIERAEALAPRGEDAIPGYRELLDQWKRVGRAGKKVDDALWARFKAAGDALYGARAEREQADVEASREKIEAKRALLDEAKAIPGMSDLAQARSTLTGIQRRWDEIGRIFPRDKERALDDELRKIEQGVKGREDADWKRNNPETKARQNDMTQQLVDAITGLEAELAAAQAAGDEKAAAQAAEALEARRSWLRALGG